MGGGITVVAGASGDLGGRIVRALHDRGAHVRAIVRRGGDPTRLAGLRTLGVEVAEVEYGDAAGLARACARGACVVSALSGLRPVIVDAQAALLDAAVAAGVPRFVPSDYCIDYTTLPRGTNRNLDLRAEFRERLDAAPVAATSVLNGMFADLLTGPAPVVLFPLRRVVYWEDADQPLDFTTIDDTAAVTAEAALDPSAPRFLRIAGEEISARGLASAASEATGQRFRLLRAGGLGRLGLLITVARTVAPGRGETFPPWQGMQYLRDMFSGRAKLAPLDNARYPELRWTSVREVLAADRAALPSGAERAAA
jgi:nucleoside-diphosphate-sugar epimerase